MSKVKPVVKEHSSDTMKAISGGDLLDRDGAAARESCASM